MELRLYNYACISLCILDQYPWQDRQNAHKRNWNLHAFRYMCQGRLAIDGRLDINIGCPFISIQDRFPIQMYSSQGSTIQINLCIAWDRALRHLCIFPQTTRAQAMKDEQNPSPSTQSQQSPTWLHNLWNDWWTIERIFKINWNTTCSTQKRLVRSTRNSETN